MSISRISKFTRLGRRIRDDEDGISAVEFALIAPMMAILYFGVIELSFMLQTDRRVTSAASTMGDLVARTTIMTNDDVQEVFQASRMIFEPTSISDARLRITSLVDNNGTVEVEWSDANNNWSARAPGSSVTVPGNLIPTGGSVIFAEVELDYSSTFGFVIKNERTLSDEFYLRPRRVDKILRDDTN